MKKIDEQVREILVKNILDGGELVERAVADGPRATLAALDRLIATLNDQANTIAIVVAGGSLSCGNPDCPDCGQAARDPAPVTTPTSLN